MKRLIALCMVCAWLGQGSPVQADMLSFQFTGTATLLTDTGTGLAGKLQGQMPLTGTFTYDTTAAPAKNDGKQATYPGATLTFNLGGYQFTSNGLPTNTTITIGHGVNSSDSIVIYAPNLTNPFAQTLFPSAVVSFADPSQTALGNDQLPTSINLAKFTQGSFIMPLFDSQRNTALVVGTITGVSPPQVTHTSPEPTSLVLFGAGAAGLVVFLRRRNATKKCLPANP